MSGRFDYVKYTTESAELQAEFKRLFKIIEAHAENHLIDSRAKSLLMTALEEAYMWTGKAIRDAQVELLGSVDTPERSNE